MKRVGLAICVSFVAVFGFVSNANAILPFKKAFQTKYVDKHSDAAFKAAFKKASCNTCHVKGKPKKDKASGKLIVNEYGEAIGKHMAGSAKRIADARKIGAEEKKAEQEKVLKELEKAFDKVAKEKSKAGDVFGDKIKSGKLPGA